jgi:hypothetical protein
LKSQIAQFEGNQAAQKNRNAYFAMLEKNNYGAMYNKYNTLMLMQKKQHLSIKIAKIEVDHRPTQIPMIY